METWVSLLLGGVAVLLVGVAIARVARVERGLVGLAKSDDLERIAQASAADARWKSLEDGLRRIGEQVAALPEPVEAKDFVPLQERLEELTRAVHELRAHVDDLRSRDLSGARTTPIGAGGRLLRSLEERGYEDVRVLGEVRDDEPGEPARVPIEARRAGMSYKGFALLEEGRIVDLALRPVTETFP